MAKSKSGWPFEDDWDVRRQQQEPRPCIHCGEQVVDRYGMGTDLGWVLASGERPTDDHCAVADHQHHEVQA